MHSPTRGPLTMAAAAIGGAMVYADPRDPRFGEISFGEDDSLSFNVFGRYAGYMKLIAQFFPNFLGYGGGRKNAKENH